MKALIRHVHGFPKPGIVFRDITTLIKDGKALHEATEMLAAHFRHRKPTLVVGVEARGFIIGTAVALKLNAGFVPARKKGKLPAKTIRSTYKLEYGTDSIEIHADAIRRGDRVLLIDDLIATGGTARACVRLIERAGGKVVGCGFLIDLSFLKGAERLRKYDVFSVIQYDSE